MNVVTTFPLGEKGLSQCPEAKAEAETPPQETKTDFKNEATLRTQLTKCINC